MLLCIQEVSQFKKNSPIGKVSKLFLFNQYGFKYSFFFPINIDIIPRSTLVNSKIFIQWMNSLYHLPFYLGAKMPNSPKRPLEIFNSPKDSKIRDVKCIPKILLISVNGISLAIPPPFCILTCPIC